MVSSLTVEGSLLGLRYPGLYWVVLGGYVNYAVEYNCIMVYIILFVVPKLILDLLLSGFACVYVYSWVWFWFLF